MLLAGAMLIAGAAHAQTSLGHIVYDKSCHACHAFGTFGAPRPGVSDEWDSRMQKGLPVLISHALSGYNAMPPRGGNPNLSDDDVQAAVHYMVDANDADTAAQLVLTAKDMLAEQKHFFRATELGQPFFYDMDTHGYFRPPAIEELPNDKYGDEVRLGRRIFTQTQKFAPRYAGRGMVCANCHLDAGRKPNAIPLWGAVGMYPGYRFSSDKNDTLEDRMADCFRNSMNGIAPAPDSPEMRALMSYANFISKGVPIGVHMPGRSFPDINYTGYEASPVRGQDIYHAKCSSCHGANGQGQRQRNADAGYLYPPLWGWNSFNKGASLYKQDKLARFIRANMPLGQEFSLSEQDAWDLASFVNMHERPKSPAKGLLQEFLSGN